MKKSRLNMILHMCFAFIMLTMIVVILAITSDNAERADSAAAKVQKRTDSPHAEHQIVLDRPGEVRGKILLPERKQLQSGFPINDLAQRSGTDNIQQCSLAEYLYFCTVWIDQKGLQSR